MHSINIYQVACNSRPPLNINTECSQARDIAAAHTAVSPTHLRWLFSFGVLQRVKVSINICFSEFTYLEPQIMGGLGPHDGPGYHRGCSQSLPAGGTPVGPRRFVLTCPDRSWGRICLMYNWYRSCFPGVKRPGRGVEQQPLPAPRCHHGVLQGDLFF